LIDDKIQGCDGHLGLVSEGDRSVAVGLLTAAETFLWTRFAGLVPGLATIVVGICARAVTVAVVDVDPG
jgi:hypothetical protein